jgi:hypothetical protein
MIEEQRSVPVAESAKINYQKTKRQKTNNQSSFVATAFGVTFIFGTYSATSTSRASLPIVDFN